MQYDVNSTTQYVEALENDWRKSTLLELRTLILDQNPSIQESINYKMLCFKLNDRILFHLNAQKSYVSLYCGDTECIDRTGELLEGLNLGKGCIRFTKSKRICETRIDDFIKQAIVLSKQGYDLQC